MLDIMILVKLFIAHILGDFFLQPQKWVADKEAKKLKSIKLYLHIGVHLGLLWLLLWDASLWPLIVLVCTQHLVIDTVKLLLQNDKTKRIWFFTDQTLHIISIAATYLLYFGETIDFQSVFSQNNLLLLLCLLFLTQPVSIIMKNVFLKWDLKTLTESDESLEDAGKYIGILERTLVFVFVILGHWQAVGFLITAKSVFRFGDLKESKQRKLTEYVLIGTLTSFGIAILVGLLYNFII